VAVDEEREKAWADLLLANGRYESGTGGDTEVEEGRLRRRIAEEVHSGWAWEAEVEAGSSIEADGRMGKERQLEGT
jgi:hypothetical protein